MRSIVKKASQKNKIPAVSATFRLNYFNTLTQIVFFAKLELSIKNHDSHFQLNHFVKILLFELEANNVVMIAFLGG